jgi:hypothetical protein
MKKEWLGVVAVVAAAAAVVIYKEAKRSATTTPAATPSAELSTPSASATPSIVLVADLSEAESEDPCAEVIRLVRAAAARGVLVREIPSGQESPLLRQYRITVEPTVLLLDTGGRVLARHEGESPETIAAIRSSLEKLSRRR